VDTRDSTGRNRFFPFTLDSTLNPDTEPKDWWYWDYIYWPVEGVSSPLENINIVCIVFNF